MFPSSRHGPQLRSNPQGLLGSVALAHTPLLLTLGTAAILGCSTTSEPVAATPDEPAVDAPRVAVETQPLNSAKDSNASAGHAWVTRTAIDYLKAWDLLPAQLDNQAARDAIAFGAYYADNDWYGRPEQATIIHPQTVWSRVPPYAGNPSYTLLASTPGTAHAAIYKRWADTLTDDNEPDLWLQTVIWQDWTISTGSVFRSFQADLYIDQERTSDSQFGPSATRKEPRKAFRYTQDNLLHYAHGEVADLNLSGYQPSFGIGDVRIFPLDWHDVPDDSIWFQDDARQQVANALRYQPIVTGSQVGLAKYGSMLYQLARKFFAGSRAEPRLSQLQKAGSSVPGWDLGATRGEMLGAVFAYDTSWTGRDMTAITSTPVPHTYLGGMPFICAGAAEPDPCQSGTAIWPGWVPATYDVVDQGCDTQAVLSSDSEFNRRCPAAITSYQARLAAETPGRSDRVAEIYLGWAAHFIQDASTPHHAANWTGFEHDKQDSLGDRFGSGAITTLYTCDQGMTAVASNTTCPGTGAAPTAFSVDQFMKVGIDGFLGPQVPATPRSRQYLCDNTLGLHHVQVMDNGLYSPDARKIYLDTLHQAWNLKKASATDADAAVYVRNALHATMKLILCAVPPTMDSMYVPVLFGS